MKLYMIREIVILSCAKKNVSIVFNIPLQQLLVEMKCWSW